jgi:hypothetical protein
MSGLIFSSMTAFAATLWGMASCRFIFVDFTSDRGDFSDFYLDPTPDGAPVFYRAGVGLFTWLQPFDSQDWSNGQCAGYTESQRDHFSDNIFEVARIFGVLSVLGGIGVTGWTLFLACISLSQIQIWIMSATLFLLTCFVGFTFLLFQAELCQDLVSYQSDDYTTECTLDQGGLVVIAAAILWCVAFLISIIYIKPAESDITISRNGNVTNNFEQRKAQRQQKVKERKMQQIVVEQKEKQDQIRQSLSAAATAASSRPPPQASPRSPHSQASPRSPHSQSASFTHSYDDGATEVQLETHRGGRSPRSPTRSHSFGSGVGEI